MDDKLKPLRESVQEMSDIEDAGEQYVSDDYEAYAETIGMKLSDEMGCWTYAGGSALTAGHDMVRALKEYEDTGKLTTLPEGEMLSNLAFDLNIQLD